MGRKRDWCWDGFRPSDHGLDRLGPHWIPSGPGLDPAWIENGIIQAAKGDRSWIQRASIAAPEFTFNGRSKTIQWRTICFWFPLKLSTYRITIWEYSKTFTYYSLKPYMGKRPYSKSLVKILNIPKSGNIQDLHRRFPKALYGRTPVYIIGPLGSGLLSSLDGL